MRVSALNLSLIRAKVTVREAGALVNLTPDVVQLAFPVHDVAPVGGDWKAAAWETDATANPTNYYARTNVGPGGTVTLVAGLYDVWVKLTHGTEVPVLRCDEPLEVF